MAQEFEKRGERHAIAEFSASMRFFQPIDPNAYAAAIGALAAFARATDLPAPVTAQTFTLNLTNGFAGSVPSAMASGWQRFAPNGEPEISVSCDPMAITYSSRRYSTWIEMLPEIVDFFYTISRFYIQTVPGISAIQVSYLNEFRSLSPTADSGRSLFKPNCRWLPQKIEEFPDAWHSHTGAFEAIDIMSRRLTNVNVDCKTVMVDGQPNPATIINAMIVVSKNYDLPDQPPLIVGEGELKDAICRDFDEIHSREKSILADLLSDQYLKEIGALEP